MPQLFAVIYVDENEEFLGAREEIWHSEPIVREVLLVHKTSQVCQDWPGPGPAIVRAGCYLLMDVGKRSLRMQRVGDVVEEPPPRAEG